MINQNKINKLIVEIIDDIVQQRFNRKKLEELKEMIEAQSLEEKANDETEQPDCETCRWYETRAFRCLAGIECIYEARNSEFKEEGEPQSLEETASE